VRVPAGKQFYVYCSEAIDLSRAKVGADDERDARAQANLEKKARDQVRRALPVDTASLLNPLLPALNSIDQNRISYVYKCFTIHYLVRICTTVRMCAVETAGGNPPSSHDGTSC